MPSQARVHPQAHLPASSGAIIDPTFTAPDFDVKAWINAALDSTSHNRKQDHQQTPPTASSASSPRVGASKDTNGDASLDASLDLLQTPALDPILDSSASVSSTQPSAQQRSHNTYLTQHATSHLTKLHLLASQTSAALSSTTQDMVKLLPRLTHELDQLRQETKALQEGIRLVRSDVHSVESTDTVQALDRLKYLDLVKTRMEATHSALREAENWRNLEAEANDIFAKGDFVKAATRLSEAERSLVVYKNTNVEGDRMALLLVLKDQLEQQIMEKVKDALEHKDTAACQTLMSVFGLIGRPEKFQDYYISQRRAPLLEQWKRSTAGDSKDFVNALQIFYKDTSSMLHDEYAWIASIFSDPTATIHSLVHDIFSHIDLTMKTTLQQISRAQGDETSLPILIDVFEATELFGTRMERIVAQPLVGMQREHGPNTANNSRSRSGTLIQDSAHKEGRAFGRSSLRRDSLDIGTRDPHEWAYILYEPFMTYQRDYGKLEESHLRSLLLKKVPAMAMNSSSSRSKESINASSNLVKIMTISIKEAFDLAGGAIGRCMRLTHGMGVPGLLDGLNGFFTEIMDRYTELLIECRQRSGLPLDESLPAPKTTFSQSQGRNSSLDIREEDEDSDGSGDDGNDQDQVNSRLFQMGLRLMVLCRQIIVKIEQLDVKTKKALKGVDEFVKMDRCNQENPPSSSEQGPAGRTNLPPHASIALLQQSNLNSFRLSEILDVVKKSAARDDAGDSSPHPDHIATGTDLGLEPKVNHLFLQSHQRAVLLTKLCQRFIFDSIYIPLVRPLVDLPLLPCWTEGMDQQGEDINSTRRIHKSTMGGTRTDVLKFRSGPSEYMGEMLRRLHALSDTFGMYEGDVGLRFGIHVLPYADKPIQDSAQASALVGVEGGFKDDDRGVGEADVAKTSKTAEDDLNEGQEPLEAEDDSAVLHRWITSLSRAAMHTMIEKLYDPNLGVASSGGFSTPANATPPSSSRSRFSESASSSPALGSSAMFQTQHTSKERHFLSRLSETGAKQLEVDLHYFVTEGLDALAIEPTPSIRSLLQALSMGEAGLLRTLQQQQQQREEHLQQQNRVQEEHEQAEKEGDASTTAGKDNRATVREDEAEQPISIYVPGAPALPSVLAAGDDDSKTVLSAQEEKIFEWVARLKGIAVLNI
ncbi:hypothetical protein BG006_000167 [Podila minutissima]|uniref:Conserved oligomeric Golgi complex subunit 7 n=1 Tax=Podila minutissima TaxID=64525 RepID=A0A9P5SFB2_9FUNG|nr:hypothetical protein BG006_000167 [Podila minutissima]